MSEITDSFNLEIGTPGSRCFKSIDHVVWNNIPNLAVLTGANGSGKTQLLELLSYRLTGTIHPQLGDLRTIPLNITGDNFGPEDIAYSSTQSNLGGAATISLAQLQQTKSSLYKQLTANSFQRNFFSKTLRAKLEKELGTDNLDSLGAEKFAELLPDDFSFMLDDANLSSGLCHVFLSYRLRYLEELDLVDKDTAQASLGPPPWDLVNDILKGAGLPYQVPGMDGTGLLKPYSLMLVNATNGTEISPDDLSSGEQVLLRLAIWLYKSEHHKRFPKLFLLDEPDAHLHPSMARQLLDVLDSVLVKKYKVRVILTTHSPSTVALAPINSIFEMHRDQPRIRQSPSQAHAVGLLTSGLVTVFPTTRFVMVEDEADVRFYKALYGVMTDYGPTRDPKAVDPSPSLVFLPASTGSGQSKVPGGKSMVQSWIMKFDSPPLDAIFKGVIDGDNGNACTDRIIALMRYSIENYLLDPFVIFALALDSDRPLSAHDVEIKKGNEHLLRQLTGNQMQAIVRSVQAKIEPLLITRMTDGDRAAIPVDFTNGTTVDYPAWMICRKGKDELLPLYQEAFGSPRVISPPRLLSMFQRVRLVPLDLAHLLRKLMS